MFMVEDHEAGDPLTKGQTGVPGIQWGAGTEGHGVGMAKFSSSENPVTQAPGPSLSTVMQVIGGSMPGRGKFSRCSERGCNM